MNSQELRTLIIAVFTILAGLGIVVSDQIPDAVVTIVIGVAGLVEYILDRLGYIQRKQVVSFVEQATLPDRSSRSVLMPGPAVPPAGMTPERIVSVSDEIPSG